VRRSLKGEGDFPLLPSNHGAQTISYAEASLEPAGFFRRASNGRRRGIALAIAIALEALILLLLLTLGAGLAGDRDGPKSEAITAISLSESEPPQPETPPEAQPEQAQTPQQPRPTPEQPAPEPTRPSPLLVSNPVPAPTPSPAPPQPSPTPTATPTAQPTAAAPARVYGPVDSGSQVEPDSQRVGTAANGEPLYAAKWYREPTRQELAGYLSTATAPSVALIACKTVPDFRVDQCYLVGESPAGSNIGRAALAAAWQFRVRPARVGGRSLVGSWVRIRIDYGVAR
jgi:periplasmic protein TonB